MYGSKPVSVIATVTLILVACMDLKARKTKGERRLSPNLFLGIIALATVPADAYEDSRADLS
jgi:hypothetical protein